MSVTPSSRIPGFYELSLNERRRVVTNHAALSTHDHQALANFGQLSQELTDTFIENAIGTFSLPLGVATNFRLNGTDVLIPMAVEETSVLAAASHGAKLIRVGGGFTTTSDRPVMSGQIQLILHQMHPYEQILQDKRQFLLDYANQGCERLVSRGGGAKDLSWYFIKEIKALVIMVHINTCDAMGANIVNTICEKISVFMPKLFPNCEVGLRILTNYSDKRRASARCCIPPHAFSKDPYRAAYVVKKIRQAWEFAYYDKYRATTHNKGIMNGIDPVVIATGNDWRAVEAGAHAWAAQSGQYRPLTTWKIDTKGYLCGSIDLPVAVGTVGGVTRLHPSAQAALKILGHPNAQQLAQIIVAVGLAQNLSALRALATEGIQRGHMNLHQKNITLCKKVAG